MTLSQGGTLTVQLAGNNGVPAMTASTPPTAVVINVTVTDTTASRYLTVYPSTTSKPLASDLNWSSGATVPNLVVVKLGTDGSLKIFNNLGQADVIIDIECWYS